LVQPKLPHLTANIKPRAVRQADIQHDQVWRVLLGVLDATGPSFTQLCLEPMLPKTIQ
jgi:hypothetical protein